MVGLWAMTPACPWTQTPATGCLGLSCTRAGKLCPQGLCQLHPLRPCTLARSPLALMLGHILWTFSLLCCSQPRGTLSGLFKEDTEERLGWWAGAES